MAPVVFARHMRPALTSQAVAQQYESLAQILVAQGSQVLVSLAPVEQIAWEQLLVPPVH